MPFDASNIKISSQENAEFIAAELMRSDAYDGLFNHFKYVGSEGAELYDENEWRFFKEYNMTSDEFTSAIIKEATAIAEDQINIAQQVIAWCNLNADKPWLDRPLLEVRGRNYIIEYQPVVKA